MWSSMASTAATAPNSAAAKLITRLARYTRTIEIATSELMAPKTMPARTTPVGAPWGRRLAQRHQTTSAPASQLTVLPAALPRSMPGSPMPPSEAVEELIQPCSWEEGRLAARELADLEALSAVDLEIGALLVVCRRRLRAVPVDLPGVDDRRVRGTPVPRAGHARRPALDREPVRRCCEVLRVEGRAGRLDLVGDGEQLQVAEHRARVEGHACRLQGLARFPVGIEGDLGGAVLGEAEEVAVHLRRGPELGPVVLVGEGHAVEHPLRVVVLLGGVLGEEDRRGGVAGQDPGGVVVGGARGGRAVRGLGVARE